LALLWLDEIASLLRSSQWHHLPRSLRAKRSWPWGTPVIARSRAAATWRSR